MGVTVSLITIFMNKAEVFSTSKNTARFTAKAQRELVPKMTKSKRKVEESLRTSNSTKIQGMRRKRKQQGAT
jgi:hypothetical protein